MPALVLPTVEDFDGLEKALLALGFEPITNQKVIDDVRRAELPRLRRYRGIEAGFIFHANGLYVKVWTTWLRAENRARQVDLAWILIGKGDAAPYYRKPIRRTKNFVQRLLERTAVTQARIIKRPHCELCNAFMEIAKRRGHLRERYWRCDLIQNHVTGSWTAWRWDVRLSPEERAIAEAWRKEEQRHIDKCKAVGKNPHQAMLDRAARRRAEKQKALLAKAKQAKKPL